MNLQLKAKGAVAVATCITKKPVLTGLITAPGGHIGRTASIKQNRSSTLTLRLPESGHLFRQAATTKIGPSAD